MSRVTKPILGLIVLLAWPCLGLGGRAEANFALGTSALATQRSAASLGIEFQLVLNGDEPAETSAPGSSSGMAHEPAPLAPAETPWIPESERTLLLVPGGPLSHGTSSPGSSSAGPGQGGASLVFILPLDFGMPGADPSGRLFLADERFNPPPFPSRLFRPPRAV